MARKMHNFPCIRCKSNVVVEIPYSAVPVAHPDVVGFLYPAAPRGKCLECGMIYVPQLKQVIPEWIWVGCEEKTDSGLIVPGAPLPKGPLPFKAR